MGLEDPKSSPPLLQRACFKYFMYKFKQLYYYNLATYLMILMFVIYIFIMLKVLNFRIIFYSYNFFNIFKTYNVMLKGVVFFILFCIPNKWEKIQIASNLFATSGQFYIFLILLIGSLRVVLIIANSLF